MSRLEKTQSNILDLLTDLHQGHVNSQRFTPKQFKEQLNVMMRDLPVGSTLPEVAQHDIKSLYKIIKGSARVTKDRVVVDIVFPLVSTTEFQILHVVPIPTEHQGKHITIIPESEYLMMTLKKDSFYQISEKELHTCSRPNARLFMCSVKGPMYTSQSTKSKCERELWMQANQIN